MVRSYLPAFALFALSATVAAAPTADNTSPDTGKDVGIAQQWVYEIQEGNLTSPKEIVAALDEQAKNGGGSLKKRDPKCAPFLLPADALEAAALVFYLATVGVDCVIAGGTDQSSALMARSPNAEIRGSKVNPSGPEQRTSCFNIALAAAKIFDECWQGDGKVKGYELVAANDQIQVNILNPFRLGVPN